MNYYDEIKETLVKNEVYKKVKDYSKNKSDLNAYYEVGRLIVEAQGGEARAKYGNKLIKEYSERLTKELGKGYTERNLRNMRSFYIKFKKWHTLCAELSWSHYRLLLPINDESEYKYYIYIASKLNKEAACLMSVVDAVNDKKSLTSDEREQSLNQMITLALETILL